MTWPVAYASDERRAELRSMPYSAYLVSPEWRQVRWYALTAAAFRCRLCARRAEHVHHATYDRRGAELPEDVVALCADCHEQFHGVARPTVEVPTHVPVPASPFESRMLAMSEEILEARRTGNDALADRLMREKFDAFRAAARAS